MSDSNRLFIGGLAYTTTPAELKEFVLGNGFSVTDAHVVLDHETGKSKGFGFITLADKVDPQVAIDSMNGMELNGRKLTVNRALPKTPKAGA